MSTGRNMPNLVAKLRKNIDIASLFIFILD